MSRPLPILVITTAAQSASDLFEETKVLTGQIIHTLSTDVSSVPTNLEASEGVSFFECKTQATPFFDADGILSADNDMDTSVLPETMEAGLYGVNVLDLVLAAKTSPKGTIASALEEIVTYLKDNEQEGISNEYIDHADEMLLSQIQIFYDKFMSNENKVDDLTADDNMSVSEAIALIAQDDVWMRNYDIRGRELASKAEPDMAELLQYLLTSISGL